MFEIGKLQQAGPNVAWIWYALLIILVLVVIFWLLNRGRTAQNQFQEEERPKQKSRTSADDLTKIEGIGP